ncbi:DUF1223 domain-containing protein [Falsihalocynthiibacter sp. SS001]|uniref:DUF1223 domain-containing protein n=1 Tax=Falsihalocynthiibacter sp. SS001 TaxID=3349698 RepID=UPI0036D311DC
MKPHLTQVARALMFSLGISVFASAAHADSGPVVVELYTSQGCSSCPPADALLEQLADRSDVIALGLHVDYWDYIGWKDAFADPSFSERQRDYARAIGKRMVYTPQMIIGGEDHVVGNKPADVESAIAKHAAAASPVSISVTKSGGGFAVEARSSQRAEMVIQLVQFTPSQHVKIKRGENAGRQINYANVVSDWREIKKWDGDGPAKFTVKNAQLPYAVIVQAKNKGRILAAARLD